MNDPVTAAVIATNMRRVAEDGDLIKQIAAEADDAMHRATNPADVEHHARRVATLLGDLREARSVEKIGHLVARSITAQRLLTAGDQR